MNNEKTGGESFEPQQPTHRVTAAEKKVEDSQEPGRPKGARRWLPVDLRMPRRSSPRPAQDQPSGNDFDWKPPRTGNQDLDDLLDVAWSLGRQVGLDYGDPFPQMCSMENMIVAFRRKYGLRPCRTTNRPGQLEELPEWPPER
jgi:hypothetical protein